MSKNRHLPGMTGAEARMRHAAGVTAVIPEAGLIFQSLVLRRREQLIKMKNDH